MGKRKYSDDDVKKAVEISYSYREVCRNLGICDHGGSPTHIKKIISNLGLDTSHFGSKSWAKGKTAETDSRIRKADISKILVENSNWQSHKVKLKLLSEGLKEHKCELCGNIEWNGKPIPLELHHINGDHHDNRIENLQLLCPNCHAQTDNYSKPKTVKSNEKKVVATCSICGKDLTDIPKSGMCAKCYNKHRSASNNCPSAEELLEKKKELKSYRQMGKYYNVADTTIKKWFKVRNLI